MAGTPPAPKLPEEIYTMFCGGIEQATAQKIVNSLTVASVNHVKRVHLMVPIGWWIRRGRNFSLQPVPYLAN